MRGLLSRNVHVRLINVSVSGFLIECSHQVDVGTTGELRLELGDTSTRDSARIMRVLPMSGSGRWFLSGRFAGDGGIDSKDSVRNGVPMTRGETERPLVRQWRKNVKV